MIDWRISDEMMDYIFKVVPEGGTILELGSGYSTYVLNQCGYNVIAIEHDPKFVLPNKRGMEGVNWIYAPIELYSNEYPQVKSIAKRIYDHKGWYDRKVLGEAIVHLRYDCILVDGPPRVFGRSGFFANLDIFRCDGIPIIFDDMHRSDDLIIAECVAQKLERDLLITNNYPGSKPFGVILLETEKEA